MIISPNIKSENDYYKIFKAVKVAFTKLNSNIKNTKGPPRKYSDEQIVACMLYGVKNSIFSLRELEYRIKQDYVFMSIIQLNQVPDLLYEAKTYNPFFILSDAAYDSVE
ncbi:MULTISPECIES: hypothetical protein [unclassified Clostridium]|uniref:hypothetical protein n=1 Tax=unclassified Clostridium TaxID=2614128 RepID=UPI00207AA1F3|nr:MULTISPECIES: hypothetical protein [unclassified Clostridium]